MEEKSRRDPVVRGIRRFRATIRRRAVLGASFAAAWVAGCSQGPSTHTLESSRVVNDVRIDFEKTSSASERFGMRSRPDARASETPSGALSSLAWDTPSGWTELSPSSMRTANFRPAGDESTECYLTLLGGDAGGLGANVNRWRGQLGLPALSRSELEALPHETMFGRDAVLVDFTGTWKGMSGSESRENWRLVGLLLVGPDGSAFLKMTGPADVVGAQRDAFVALARSFRPVNGGTTSGDPHADPHAGSGVDPHAGMSASPNANADAPADSGGAQTAAGFTFTAPRGWRRAPDRPSRAFTLYAGPGEDLECYVTALAGDGGGALANVNRWRGQLGLTGLTEADMALMPSVNLLGREALLVECDGTSASLLGAALNGAEGSVFVKMTGPRDLVKAQRGAFLSFCSSLVEAH